MYADLNYFLQSGFPLLLLILWGIALYNIWRKEGNQRDRLMWSAIVIGPPLLAGLVYVLFDLPLMRELGYFIAFLIISLSGFLVWMLKR